MRYAASLALVSLLAATSCHDQSRAQATPRATARVATYNIEWFSEGASPSRINRLKSVVQNLNADVIALQEIQSRKALQQVFGEGWDISIADLPEENQELALVVRKPFVLVNYELVFKGPLFEDAFPGGRDVLRAVVQAPTGKRLVFYVVHMKSRGGGRRQTDPRREAAAGLLASFIAARYTEKDVVVLGDFNDAPDDRSLKILETGDLLAQAGDSGAPTKFLRNLNLDAWKNDAVTFGLHELYTGRAVAARVPGAKADNARLRGQDYRYPDDVKVRQIMFDQILVSPSLADGAAPAQVYSGGDALEGKKGSVKVADEKVSYEQLGDLASDHLPVSAEIGL
ncbi:MAG: endonuclease/exonuclease/phosphatase family protein [Fimbriimonadaceae bacterium]|nr:endonuclease/exonuclease/phosphatase family protein [Fimbriimonadaceae bacterium]QYK55115.1 MAG: endonuclease/exonuclease/phosphatase family protein [Fimbriimonadaceae bacterium]